MDGNVTVIVGQKVSGLLGTSISSATGLNLTKLSYSWGGQNYELSIGIILAVLAAAYMINDYQKKQSKKSMRSGDKLY